MSSSSSSSDEGPPPVLDRPLVVSGKRDRTQTKEVYKVAEKKEKEAFVVKSGKGIQLREMENVMTKLKGIAGHDPRMKDLHRVMYGRAGKGKEVKRNILDFSGLQDVKASDAAEKKLKKWSMTLLKGTMTNLCIDRSAKSFDDGKLSKENLISRFIEWLNKPHLPKPKAKSIRTPAAKKKKSSVSTGGGTKKRKRSDVGENDENEISGDDTDVEDADDEEVSQPVKKRAVLRQAKLFVNSRFMLTPNTAEAKEYLAKEKRFRANRSKANAKKKEAATKRRRRTNAKLKKKKARAKQKKSTVKQKKAKKKKIVVMAASSEEESSSSDDEEPITVSVFKKAIKAEAEKILKDANMDEVTVGSLCKAIAKALGKKKSEVKAHKPFVKSIAVAYATR